MPLEFHLEYRDSKRKTILYLHVSEAFIQLIQWKFNHLKHIIYV